MTIDLQTLRDDPAAVQNLLETRSTHFIAAINARSFDPSTYPWNLVDEKNYSASLPMRGQTSFTSFAETMSAWPQYTAQYPEYAAHVMGVSSSLNLPGSGGGFAEVYVDVRLTGDNHSMAKQCICKMVWLYQKDIGDWRAVSTESYPGMVC